MGNKHNTEWHFKNIQHMHRWDSLQSLGTNTADFRFWGKRGLRSPLSCVLLIVEMMCSILYSQNNSTCKIHYCCRVIKWLFIKIRLKAIPKTLWKSGHSLYVMWLNWRCCCMMAAERFVSDFQCWDKCVTCNTITFGSN